MPAVIGVLSALKTERRKLLPSGLAEGEELETNILSQIFAADLRSTSHHL
jgi:hypothetical protein